MTNQQQMTMFVEQEETDNDGNVKIVYKISEDFMHHVYLHEIQVTDLQESTIFKFLVYKIINCYERFNTSIDTGIYNKIYKFSHVQVYYK